MDCPTCEAMVESYLDGELPAGESARFEAALAECPECRAKLERLQTQRALIRDLSRSDAPAACPHGSPLLLHFSSGFLERQFGW